MDKKNPQGERQGSQQQPTDKRPSQQQPGKSGQQQDKRRDNDTK